MSTARDRIRRTSRTVLAAGGVASLAAFLLGAPITSTGASMLTQPRAVVQPGLPSAESPAALVSVVGDTSTRRD
ncbi:MAG: hypothetical protein ABWZ26_00315 [Candidatus Nanopelagicales bacterium]